MKWLIVRNAWWMFWAQGMVFFRWVLLKPQPTVAQDHRLFRHELEHCYDQCRMGSKWKWYWAYLKWGIRHGWSDTAHRDEAEAEAVEQDMLDPQELIWYETGVIRMICK